MYIFVLSFAFEILYHKVWIFDHFR